VKDAKMKNEFSADEKGSKKNKINENKILKKKFKKIA